MKRKCPSCCPDVAGACFVPTYDAENEFSCANCGHRVTIRRRPRKIGGERQRAAVERAQAELSERYNVTDEDHDGFWAERGTVCLFAKPRAWYNDGLLIYVGPRGALKVVDLRDGKKRRGRDAWIWLSVVGR